MSSHPYQRYVSECARLVREGKSLPLGGFPPPRRPSLPTNAQRALFFAPHPDDETINGSLALRLMREAQMKVSNVAVTQGSKTARQAERLRELQAACEYIGFELLTTGPNGLERVNPETRQRDPGYWKNSVKVITDILKSNQPRVILFPHERDWNTTHIGTHFLVMDALRNLPAEFECYLVETEFWGQNDSPNLMVEISAEALGELIAATTFHVGEVQRNPYHLLMPAWMMDNVRRGTELVGGQGAAAPEFTFAGLYRLRKWQSGKVVDVFSGGKNVPITMNVGELFR